MPSNGMDQSFSISSPVKFLALGDSYTIGESVAEDERWPTLLAKAFRKRNIICPDPKIIATTGWRTDELKEAILKAKLSHYNLVSLLIGVNNQYQGKSLIDYEHDFEELLVIALNHVGGNPTKVFVLSIPDYGYTPFGAEKQAEISKSIDAFNTINRKVAENHKVPYFDITPISRRAIMEPALVASDGLHPSGEMYKEWVQLILDEIKL